MGSVSVVRSDDEGALLVNENSKKRSTTAISSLQDLLQNAMFDIFWSVSEVVDGDENPVMFV